MKVSTHPVLIVRTEATHFVSAKARHNVDIHVTEGTRIYYTHRQIDHPEPRGAAKSGESRKGQGGHSPKSATMIAHTIILTLLSTNIMKNADDPRSKFFQYKPGDDVGPLEDWPFDNPASNYVIPEGSSPLASGRIDHGGPGHTSRFGIWKCTKGVFSCTEQGDEMFTILSGKCRLVDHTKGDTSYDLGPSDGLFVLDGSRVTWDITEDVVKVFYGQKLDRF
jgi:uncharacterized cupin superfamily protein